MNTSGLLSAVSRHEDTYDVPPFHYVSTRNPFFIHSVVPPLTLTTSWNPKTLCNRTAACAERMPAAHTTATVRSRTLSRSPAFTCKHTAFYSDIIRLLRLQSTPMVVPGAQTPAAPASCAFMHTHAPLKIMRSPLLKNSYPCMHACT